MIPVPVEMLQLMLKHAEDNNNAISAAAQIVDSVEQYAKFAQKQVPGIIASLRDAGLIEAHEVKEAEAALSDPRRTLQVLANTVNEYRRLQAKGAVDWQSQGQTKAASDTGHTKKAVSGWKANIAGYRYGQDEVSESDRILLRLIGRD
jgi:hypothetical protein